MAVTLKQLEKDGFNLCVSDRGIEEIAAALGTYAKGAEELRIYPVSEMDTLLADGESNSERYVLLARKPAEQKSAKV